MNPSSTHLHIVQEAQRRSNSLSSQAVVLDGRSLDIASVVEVARNAAKVEITKDQSVLQGVQDSLDFLATKDGVSIYGVTTGFGGSADTRTNFPEALQMALLEHQLCGYLPTKDGDALTAAHMPEEIVRGAMVIRVNSLLRGHSAIRLSVLESMVKFLNLGITPLVPLRSSISASGDLSSLAYIAASLCGHPDLRVIDRSSGSPVIKPCAQALEENNMEKVSLRPKEGLALINGTAYSASAGSLAMYDTNFLALLSQATTALTTEAMVGMKGSYDPFIHDVCRPHVGQVETAANISKMLKASKLAVEEEEDVSAEFDTGVLRQDRYPLRTSPQFAGPQIESIMLAHTQISTELNTTTDNPLIDAKGKQFHHGGNFQAMSISVAVESVRSAVQLIGRLSFAQLTELLNCGMNRGLPSCLAGSEPSTNYHCKGLDIASAAYAAELGFLSGSQAAHFQSAEMHNQAVNSMALASARRTIEANQVLTLLLSTHLYAACQAIDLRVLDKLFRFRLAKTVSTVAESHLKAHLSENDLKEACVAAKDHIMRRLDQTTSADSVPRITDAFDYASSVFIGKLSESKGNPLASLNAWKAECTKQTIQTYNELREQLFSGKLDVASNLGQTKSLYHFVRNVAGVQVRKGDVESGGFGPTIGSSVSRIVEALNTSEGRDAILACFGPAKQTNGFH